VPLSKKAYALSLSALLYAPLVGCGGTSSSKIPSLNLQGPSGKVTQGAVNGATIWADALGSPTSFVIDTSEQGTSTKTTSTGTYIIPETPSYKYVLVSQGGTDTITGKTALTLVAPGGAQSVSPLTTLVAFDQTGNLANSINALLPAGKTFDSDLTVAGALTPATMVFITSLTTAVTALQAAIVQAATKGGTTLTPQQINDINLTLFSQMATQFATIPAASLSNTAGLATNLQTSLCGALTAVSSNNSNITGLSCSMAETIANDSVTTAANVVGNATGNTALQKVTASNVQSTPVTVATTGAVTEASVMSFGSNTTLVNNTINTVATGVSTAIAVTATPPVYAPPAIPIIQNPSVIGYSLVAVANGNAWTVDTFKITFSDDMVATESGDATYAHSVLNPANFTYNQTGCSPSSYASKVVTFNCGTLSTGNFVVTIPKATTTSGVWASATSLGTAVNVAKTFNLAAATGATSVSLF
jgi:hypothetical protein